MTYGQFLLLFLVFPILLLAFSQRRRLGRRRWMPLAILMSIAFVYTTPWDNYLVANGIWWYGPDKVLGWTLGWVPLEEYLFFLLQPLLTGLLYLRLAPVVRPFGGGNSMAAEGGLQVVVPAFLGLVWVGSLYLLRPDGPSAARYLALQLAWAVPPLMLQTGFGADLIRRRLLPAALTLAVATCYLLAADAVAIEAGIWAIDPLQTLGWNPLPSLVFEEGLFFLLTNALVIGGLVLLMDPASGDRWRGLRCSLGRTRGGQAPAGG